MIESEELKSLFDESERGEWKSWLKTQHSKSEDHGIQSHHFMANRWGNNANSERLYFWGAPSSLQMVTQFSSVQLLSCVQLFVTPWIAACQASLSITNSRSSLNLMSIELVMPSSYLILCLPLLLLPQSLPASESFPMSQLFAWGGQSTSALASFLPKKSQGWSPSECTGWI